MKQYILFLFVLILLSYTTKAVYATTPTPNPTSAAASGLDQAINNLKDRIASRVAQLNLVEKKGMIGTVTDISETQITVTDLANNTQFVDVDELTKFASPDAKGSFGISDITKGTTLGILGRYNKETRRILARFVDVVSFPMVISGAITQVDKSNFLISITTPDQKEYIGDIQNVTKTYTYTKTDGLTKSGFSKLQVGQRVMLVGFPEASNKNKILASRIIDFVELPPNPKIILMKPDAMGVTPSTGSGTKLVPIIKAH